MKKKTPISPMLPSLVSGDFYLEDEADFSGLDIQGGDQSYLTADNLRINESHAAKLVLQKSVLTNVECSNVIFENCDFSNLEWLSGSFRQVIFKQCKMIGTNFAESYLRDCQFIDCVASMASFSNTDLKVVSFENCQLENTEFYEIKWQHLSLKDNKLTGSNWLRTPLKNLDLTTNHFHAITFSQEQLAGLIVDQEQALTIAASLGLVIQD